MKIITLRMIIIGLVILFSLNSYSSQSTHSSIISSNGTQGTSSKAIVETQDKIDHDFSDLKIKESQKYKFCFPYLRPFCRHLHQTWTEGSPELYLSGYAWHNRFTYSAERLHKSKYNELAWGGGFGKGFFDENGNWHGLYAFAFLDSHKNLEPVAGYAFLKVANVTQNFKAGLGFSVLVTARPDILDGIPFPGAVPWAGVFYKKLSIKAAYIPGSSKNGNVLYLVGTYTLDK